VFRCPVHRRNQPNYTPLFMNMDFFFYSMSFFKNNELTYVTAFKKMYSHNLKHDIPREREIEVEKNTLTYVNKELCTKLINI